MTRHVARTICTIDAETDPFVHGRIPQPFLWGFYDGKDFKDFERTSDMVDYISGLNSYIYAHNGGKFDFMYLLQFLSNSRAKIINGRIVEVRIGNALLRDSWAIIPVPLRNFQKLEIDYAKLESEVRREHWPEIVEYLKVDCTSLYNVVTEYAKVAGKKSTLASNGFAHAKRLGIDPGKTSMRFDNTFREFYYGGRVEVFKAGKFKNINVFDVTSLYPHAMYRELPCGGDYMEGSSLKGLTDKEIDFSFIELSCFSEKAFPIIEDHSMNFPERLGTFRITGWEYRTAKDLGLIKGEKIKKVLTQRGTIDYRPYVDFWFDHKDKADKAGDKTQREIAKRMLVACYGKLGQNAANYMDYEIHSTLDDVDHENGWTMGAVFGDKCIHNRPTIWRYQQKYGDEWVKFPINYNVGTCASITGFARALLLKAIHTVGIKNVIYCDTDSLVTVEGTDTFSLDQSGKLGSWKWEGRASEGIFCGKKLYALKFDNGPEAGKVKVACKGAKLEYSDMEKIALGEIVTWEAKAPTFRLGHETRFMVRQIRQTANL